MKLNNFTGGLKTRVSPNLLSISEAQTCTNIDLLKGSIAPIKTDLLYSSDSSWLNKVNFYLFNGVWVKKNSGTSFVLFDNRLYYSQGSGELKVTTNGTNEYSLGIIAPTTKLSITSSYTLTTVKVLLNISTSEAIAGDIAKLKVADNAEVSYTLLAADIAKGYIEYTSLNYTISDYDVVKCNLYTTKGVIKTSLEVVPVDTKTLSYTYSYYSSITGYESALAPYSEEIEVLDGSTMTLTGFASSPDTTVDTIRLYRLGGDLTSYTLVTEFVDTTATYSDSATDLSLAENDIVINYDFGPPQSGLNYLTLYSFTLFAALGNKLYFSNYASPDQWSEFNSFNFPDNITGIGATPNGLLVFTRNQTYLIRGTDSSNFNSTILNTSLGCVTHSTIQYLNNSLIWLSTDGILASNGASINNLTEIFIGKQSLTPYNSVVYNNQYMLLHSTGTLAVDFRTGAARLYEIDTIYKGGHYAYTLNSLFMYTGDTIVKFQEGTSNRVAKYKTGWITENGMTTVSIYRKLYTYTIGTISITLYIDGIKALDNITLSAGFNEFTIPTSRGYYMEIETSGTGELIEVDYTLENRSV